MEYENMLIQFVKCTSVVHVNKISQIEMYDFFNTVFVQKLVNYYGEIAILLKEMENSIILRAYVMVCNVMVCV